MKEIIPSELDVWVLAGQSNMQGCGLMEGALAPDEQVCCFTMAGNWEVAEEPLHRLWESIFPVHQKLMRPHVPEELLHLTDAEMAEREIQEREGYEGNGSAFGGTGLGMAFGKAMSEATGKRIGLIPAAHGGTSLEQWSPAHKEQGGDSLYGALLERIKLAGGRLRGILWYQGEADCSTELSETYLQRMEAWINAVREDTGQSDLAVIVVQLGRFVGNFPIEAHAGWDRVREALIKLPYRLPNVAATSTVDLALADAIHVDTRALIRLGNRMAQLALAMEAYPDEIAGPQVVALKDDSFRPGLGAVLIQCRGVNGGWKPETNMSGFTVHDANSAVHPTVQVIDASTEFNDPATIRVLLNGNITPDLRIGYGLGCNPYCNVVDGSDMPLLAFTPRGIEEQ